MFSLASRVCVCVSVLVDGGKGKRRSRLWARFFVQMGIRKSGIFITESACYLHFWKGDVVPVMETSR